MKKRRRCTTCKCYMKGHNKKQCLKSQRLELEDGAIYEGTIYAGRPSGRGRLVSQELTYNGEFRDGKKHGYGVERDTNGYQYSGTWQNGLYHGQGELQKSNGSTYKGTFRCGTFHGIGTLVRGETTYTGHWCHGTYHGEGTLHILTGTYEGIFYYGVQHGEGTFTDKRGNIYSGRWRKGLRHGQGIYTTDDGTYTGKWLRNLESGFGRLVSKTTGVYVGEWKRGLRHNQGEQIYPNGTRYNGGWSRGKKTGHGVQEWNDGAVYRGFWLNDEYNGRGTLTIGKKSFSGVWSEGQREGVFVETREDGSTSKGTWVNDLRHGTFEENGKVLYLWGRVTSFRHANAARRTAIRLLKAKDYIGAEAVLHHFPAILNWTFLYKNDLQGAMLYLVDNETILIWIKKYAWLMFRKKRFLFIEAMMKQIPTDKFEYCSEQCTELFDQLSRDFVANPWMVHNISYSEATRKKLLAGLHLGDFGRCPPKDPFTREILTPESGKYLSDIPKGISKKIYATFTKYIGKKPEIRQMAYEFDLQDFETHIQNARDAKDIKTLRRLLLERDAFIKRQKAAPH